MKSFISLAWAAFLVLLFSACEQISANQSEGNIFQYDFRRCMCCGGVFIDIEGDTLRIPVLSDPFFQDFDQNDLPLRVKLTWEPEAEPCLGDEIVVFDIERF